MSTSSSVSNNLQHFDVAIVGGAMVGSVLALGLEQLSRQLKRNLNIALIEAFKPKDMHPGFDARAIALAEGSIQSLVRLGVWQEIKALGTAIKHIHVSDRGHFGMTNLYAQDFGLEAMGEVIELNPVGYQLYSLLEKSNVTLFCPAQLSKLTPTAQFHQLQLDDGSEFAASLVVGADGAQSKVRQALNVEQQTIDFNQSAVIANVSIDEAHNHQAWERFTENGPLALLPMSSSQGQDRLSLVWAMQPEQATEIAKLPETTFLEQLQQAFGFRAGKFTSVGERHCYPLKLTYLQRPIYHRCVFVGNAAQTLHPIAGQGFNLGLRDIDCLLSVIKNALLSDEDLGATSVTHEYLKGRTQDRTKTIDRIEWLVRGFSNNYWPMVIGRSLGLRMLSWLPPLKSPVARKAMGYTTDSIF
ncbi:MAG: 2-octaprenyl-6-methoxyphenyl hydroxylase [Parashewanella sp.]